VLYLCDSDTENDDTLTSAQSHRVAAAASSSSTAITRLDDIIDNDSDFEVTSKPRVSAASRGRTKYYIH